MAFHPDYARNGRFFVFYTAQEEGTPLSIVAEYRVSPDGMTHSGQRAEPHGQVILRLPRGGRGIHMGGQLQFGPDGYLYVSLGDDDAPENGQNLGTLSGSVLRLDVDKAQRGYTVPADNPFVGQAGARGEIWAYGFRNPWRFSFDPCTGALLLGDVDSLFFEEVNLVERGQNYGCAQLEGQGCVGVIITCTTGAFVPAAYTYAHLKRDPEGGNSVVGGLFYRGSRYPQLRGRYLFADFTSWRIWALTAHHTGESWDALQIGETPEAISAFASDATGEIFAVGFASGTLYRLDREELVVDEVNFARAEPRTVRLQGFGPLRQAGRWGQGQESSLEFHLDESQNITLFFEALSPVRGQHLEVLLNGEVVSAYDFRRGPRFDWLLLKGKEGRNELVLRYHIVQPEALRFTALELEALELED